MARGVWDGAARVCAGLIGAAGGTDTAWVGVGVGAEAGEQALALASLRQAGVRELAIPDIMALAQAGAVLPALAAAVAVVVGDSLKHGCIP
ncbi:MAG: hypothetical protein WBX25_09415 [Rhodomicrobium sp.]